MGLEPRRLLAGLLRHARGRAGLELAVRRTPPCRQRCGQGRRHEHVPVVHRHRTGDLRVGRSAVGAARRPCRPRRGPRGSVAEPPEASRRGRQPPPGAARGSRPGRRHPTSGGKPRRRLDGGPATAAHGADRPVGTGHAAGRGGAEAGGDRRGTIPTPFRRLPRVRAGIVQKREIEGERSRLRFAWYGPTDGSDPIYYRIPHRGHAQIADRPAPRTRTGCEANGTMRVDGAGLSRRGVLGTGPVSAGGVDRARVRAAMSRRRRPQN